MTIFLFCQEKFFELQLFEQTLNYFDTAYPYHKGKGIMTKNLASGRVEYTKKRSQSEAVTKIA